MDNSILVLFCLVCGIIVKEVLYKRGIMRNDIVVQAKLYLECKYLTLFTIALVYQGIPVTRNSAQGALDSWAKTGHTPKYLGDFCLDILSGRLVASWDLKNPQEIRFEERDGKA